MAIYLLIDFDRDSDNEKAVDDHNNKTKAIARNMGIFNL